jgi:methyltransferase
MTPRVSALLIYLVVVGVQRAAELALSRRHARALAARGGREFGRALFAVFVALLGCYPLALAAEVLILRATPPAHATAWLALWLAAQGLRVWAMRSLGEFWNVRVWVLPHMRPVARGPYRWLRHPNYLAVAVEFVAAPMMFGAWRTALAFSALNALAMGVRIPVENRALAWAMRGGDIARDSGA